MTTGTTERTATDSIAQTTDVQYFSRPIECQFEDTTVLLLGTGNQPGHSMVGIYRGRDRKLRTASLGQFDITDRELMTGEEWQNLLRNTAENAPDSSSTRGASAR